MSNLGFQTIYRHLNALPDVVCERVFLPDPEDIGELERTEAVPISLESFRPLTDFHMVGFSVTYEGDYVNVLRLLALARIPLRPEDRRPHDPLVLMGGVCAFSNPEPVAPFMDVIVVGEGEELVAELIAAYREGYDDRARFLDALAQLEGVYVPSRYEVVYAPDGTVGEVLSLGAAPAIVTKRRLRNVNAFETVDAVKTPHAEYGHMALLEVGKGCGRGCRFCLEGQVYRPVRHRSVDALRETVARVAASGEKRVGLVGACVSDYPWIGELLKIVEDNGLELSISSIRADSLTDDLVAALARGGHRTLTIAPEAGTERLRRAIRKAITDEQILTACDLVRAHGIPNLKTYFMIGQPTETLADVEAIPLLAERMLERLRVLDPSGKPFGRLTLSVSSFVPKPWTPFQWAPFDGAESLQAKLEIVKRGARRFSNVRVLHENPREAALQALLARGDRRVAGFLELAAAFDGDWRRALRGGDGDPDFCPTRGPSAGEPLLRRDLPRLIRLLAAKPRLRDLAITTNGVLLAELAGALKEAGLHRVTVSLDTLRAERFAALTRRQNHAQVLEGIQAVTRAGFPGTKLGTVVIPGVNDDELVDLIEFGKRVAAEVRFIEYMDVGGATRWSMDQVVSRKAMLEILESRYGRIEPVSEQTTAPAERYRLRDGTVFGIISSTTAPFCAECDRSRLTADGMWYLCLYALQGTDLRAPLRRGAKGEELAALITGPWQKRSDRGAEQRLALRERAPLVQVARLKEDPHLEMHTRGG